MRPLPGLAVAALVVLPAWPAHAQGAAAPVAPSAAAPAVATYQIDPVHSELTFRVRHLLGRVAGTFREWGGTVVMDNAKPANSKGIVDVEQ
jgi:polyisoprenoid-binding protein YceI